jgi:hypothetical protein
MFLHGLLCDVEKLIFPHGWTILLGKLQVPKLCDSLLGPNNMNFRLVSHLPTRCIPITDCAWLPFFLKTKAPSPKIVAEHLFTGECLPKVCSHSVLLDRSLYIVTLSVHLFRYGIKRSF